MLDVTQFRDNAIRPVLSILGKWNAAMNTQGAENILVGTALQESNLTYLRQLSGGPALSIMQIEPATHDDVWTNYINERSDLAAIVKTLAADGKGTSDQLPWNMGYAVAIARLIYWRQPQALPSANDIDALGQYWKDHYNTAGGAGSAPEWVANYNRYGVKPS